MVVLMEDRETDKMWSYVALTVDMHTDCQCVTDVINCQQHMQ